MSDFENELQLDGQVGEFSADPASPASVGAINPDAMHDLFEGSISAATDEEDPLAQLRNDPNYSALIKDLEYIAAQARSLFDPVEEAPSDIVWDKIESQLPALGNKTKISI